jgi:hypothetical protein
MKLRNDYMSELGTLYAATPKAVFAAIAVSYATCGGDYIERAHENVLRDWWVLHENGIVPQRPPYPKPPSPA